MLPDGLAERAEDDAFLREGFSEGRGHGHRVEDRIHGDYARQGFALLQRDTEFLEGLGQFGVNFLGPVCILLRSSIVDNILEINGRHIQMPPFGHRHPLPPVESVETEVQQPLRLAFPLGNHPDDLFVQPLRNIFLLHVGDKAFFVLLRGEILYDFILVLSVHVLAWGSKVTANGLNPQARWRSSLRRRPGCGGRSRYRAGPGSARWSFYPLRN